MHSHFQHNVGTMDFDRRLGAAKLACAEGSDALQKLDGKDASVGLDDRSPSPGEFPRQLVGNSFTEVSDIVVQT